MSKGGASGSVAAAGEGEEIGGGEYEYKPYCDALEIFLVDFIPYPT
jgi:hypothetical protein